MQKKLMDLALVAIVIVVYDAMASVASRALNVNYIYFAGGSILLYLLAAFLVSWRHGFFMGVLAGFLIGFADSTAGLAVFLWLGPEEFKDAMRVDLISIFVVVAFVTVEAGIIGLIASGAASMIKRFAPSPAG